MNKTIAIALLLLATTFLLYSNMQSSSSDNDLFEQWKKSHSYTFQSQADEFYRRSIFEKNVAKIKAHNSDPSSSYKMGINQFSIYTEMEFRERFLGLKINEQLVS